MEKGRILCRSTPPPDRIGPFGLNWPCSRSDNDLAPPFLLGRLNKKVSSWASTGITKALLFLYQTPAPTPCLYRLGSVLSRARFCRRGVSFLPLWRSSSSSRVDPGKRGSVESPVLESARSSDGGAFCQGYGGGCGRCGKLEDGSSSRSRWQESSASFVPGSVEFGVHSRPMLFQRRFHPGFFVGCPLRLLSKFCSDGALPNPWWPRRLPRRRPIRRCWSAETSGGFE